MALPGNETRWRGTSVMMMSGRESARVGWPHSLGPSPPPTQAAALGEVTAPVPVGRAPASSGFGECPAEEGCHLAPCDEVFGAVEIGGAAGGDARSCHAVDVVSKHRGCSVLESGRAGGRKVHRSPKEGCHLAPCDEVFGAVEVGGAACGDARSCHAVDVACEYR